MIQHKRKDEYWKYYHLADTQERDFLVDNIVSLVNQNPPTAKKKKEQAWQKAGPFTGQDVQHLHNHGCLSDIP